jgi:CubicO group peptidase (beta-lactamase class C family)
MKTTLRTSARLLSMMLLPALSLPTVSQAQPVADPGIRAAMERFIQAHEIAGAVTLVATPDQVLHLDAVGHADVASGRPMKPDSLFWIASMTKPVTGVAVMMLEEAGKLSLEDPVSKHLPEFEGVKTADGQPASLTIRHLLTHTSGMAEISPDEARRCRTLADAVALYAGRPLVAVLPIVHQHGGADCRGGFRRIVPGVPGTAVVRAAGHERHHILPEPESVIPAGHLVPAHRRRRARGE